MSKETVLGIDTSCYTTSCALVALGGQVLASVRVPLKVDQGERGLRQSEAVFQHVKQLPEAVRQAMREAGQPRIMAVCASTAPLDGQDSYMPVFVTGSSYAKGIASALQVPFYGTSHQQGHFAAARIGISGLPENHLGMHLSGGTTQVVRIEKGSVQLLGDTLDLSAGQLIDRVGVARGLQFPAGPGLEQLAVGTRASGVYPAIVKDGMGCSFSGVEAAALKDIAAGKPAAVVAAEVFDCVARVVLKMGRAAARATGCQDLLITGGVASSQLLKDLLQERTRKRGLPLRLHFGQSGYAGDNAAGVAMIGLQQYITSKEA